MNRIENILLALATAAAFLVAGTAKADPGPCPETVNKRPAIESSEGLNDGLNGTPVFNTPTGTTFA